MVSMAAYRTRYRTAKPDEVARHSNNGREASRNLALAGCKWPVDHTIRNAICGRCDRDQHLSVWHNASGSKLIVRRPRLFGGSRLCCDAHFDAPVQNAESVWLILSPKQLRVWVTLLPSFAFGTRMKTLKHSQFRGNSFSTDLE